MTTQEKQKPLRERPTSRVVGVQSDGTGHYVVLSDGSVLADVSDVSWQATSQQTSRVSLDVTVRHS